MPTSDANIRAYQLFKRLLRRANCSLNGAEEFIPYSFETIRSWGKRGRSFPDQPALLRKIVRELAQRTPLLDAECAHEALQFLVLAGYPPSELDELIDCFPTDLFHAAKQAALALVANLPFQLAQADSAIAFLHAAALDHLPAPQALPAGSLGPPFPPYSRFRGRDEILRELFSALRANYPVVITGMAGLGKSLLASELVHRVGTSFRGGVFWLSAERPDYLPAQIAKCGAPAALNLHPGYAHLDQARQIELVRAAWAQPIPRLIILDNAEDPALFQQFAPYLGGSRLLITSRRNDWQRVPGLKCFGLEGLARHESIAFLAEECVSAAISASLADLDRLAAEVGDLPLGLLLIGRALHHGQRGDPLRSATSAAILDPSPSLTAPAEPTNHPHRLNNLITRTLEQLDDEDTTDRRARHLLEIAACLAPGEAIPTALLRLIADQGAASTDEPRAQQRYQRAIERLIDLGVLEHAGAAALRIHRLIATATGTRQLRTVAETLLAAWRRQFVGSDTRWAQPYLVHLHYVTDQALHSDPAIGGLLAMELGWHLTLDHQNDAAIRYQQQSVAALWAARGWDDESAEALCRLALAYQVACRMRESERTWDQLLQLDQTRLAEGSLARALTYKNVGYIKLILAKYHEAYALLRQSLAIRRSQLPLAHHDIARTLFLLGRWCEAVGQYRNGRRYLRLSIAILERDMLNPSIKLLRAHCYSILGEIEHACGMFHQATSLFQQAHTLRLTLVGQVRSEGGRILNQLIALDYTLLGRVAMVHGEPATALRYFREGLAINEQLLGAEAIDTAMIAEDLGNWYILRGSATSAIPILEYAFGVYTRTLDHPSPILARIRLSIAQAHLQSEAWASLHEALAQAQQIMAACNLPKHPLWGWIAAVEGDAAAAHHDQARATECYRHAIQIIAREAPQHPRLAFYRLRLEAC